MQFFTITIVLLIGGFWIIGAIAIGCFQSQTHPRWLRFSRMVASLCMVLGALGFFGGALSSFGGLNWVPDSFEWPIGRASGVIQAENSYYIVPHTPSGRVQVYDKDWKFIKGWNVDAKGGVFKLDASEGNTIDVFTARGDRHYRYSIDGSLLLKDEFATGSYSDVGDSGQTLTVPTRWWLWSFTSPVFSWALAAIGFAVIVITVKVSKHPKADREVA